MIKRLTGARESKSGIQALEKGKRQREVENIIVVIPGTGTASGTAGDALVMTAHYDSFYGSNGASDNGVSVAAMLETIKVINICIVVHKVFVASVVWRINVDHIDFTLMGFLQQP